MVGSLLVVAPQLLTQHLTVTFLTLQVTEPARLDLKQHHGCGQHTKGG